MGFITKDQILAAQDRKTVDVDVPEWGGMVRVREMSALDRDAFFAEQKRREGQSHQVHALLCALSLVDENGEPLFTKADVESLARKSPNVLARVVDAAWTVNGFTTDAADEAKKNSSATQDGGSHSASL